MTLFKQLLIGVFLLFFILMSSIFFTQYRAANNFLTSQQNISMHNLSYALQLAIQPYFEDSDDEKLIHIAESLYQKGFKGYIKLQYKNQPTPLIEHFSEKENSAPTWFQKVVNLDSTSVTQTLNYLEKEPLIITVTSSTDHAYLQLWRATYHLLLNFLWVLFISIILLILMIRHILTPIKSLQLEADNIAQQNFSQTLPITNISELKDLTQSFSRMSTQIHDRIHKQAQEAEQLRQKVYQDPITKLANLDYLITSKHPLLSNNQHSSSLLLLHSELIEHHLENGELNDAELLAKQMANQLKALVNHSDIIANISLFEFILIQSTQSHDELKKTVLAMLNKASEIPANSFHTKTPQARIGVVTLNEQDDLHHSIHKARIAVQENQNHLGDNVTFYTDENHANIQLRSAEEWRGVVKRAVAQMGIKLTTQHVLSHTNSPIHREVFAHIEHKGQQFHASQFINAIQYHHEGLMFDMHVLELVFQKLVHSPSTLPVTINITINSIINANFVRWIDSKLTQHSHLAEQLLFELPEIIFIQHTDKAYQFVQTIQKHQFHFGIDHFGQHLNQINYLSTFSPAYAKLDHTYTAQISDPKKQDSLSSLLNFLDNFNILLIATWVENTDQMKALSKFKIQGFQ